MVWREKEFSRLHREIFNRPVLWSVVCRGCVRGKIQSDNGLYCDVIFLGGTGCQIFTSHPVLLAPTICKLNSIFRRRNKSTRDFVPRFRYLENRSLSQFRSRLVVSLPPYSPRCLFLSLAMRVKFNETASYRIKYPRSHDEKQLLSILTVIYQSLK